MYIPVSGEGLDVVYSCIQRRFRVAVYIPVSGEGLELQCILLYPEKVKSLQMYILVSGDGLEPAVYILISRAGLEPARLRTYKCIILHMRRTLEHASVRSCIRRRFREN